MSDKFFPLPLSQLLQRILNQYDRSGFIFSIPKELFFVPNIDDPFRIERFGQALETPFGVAAGPHTQLAQNIVASWLTGARFIELKTIQTMDELEVSKPCIDMQDEGYNCEWSQELKIHQSFHQYLDAWILIHILKDKLNIGNPDIPGFIFNMSVGYNLEGILQENVQWFFDKMKDASAELAQKIETIKDIYPNIKNLKINSCLSDNITLSTMHGCPPDEIEKIGEYLINEKKLHTAIKLNPTLLGKKDLSAIFSNNGFETIIPHEAFEHDLKYPDAIKIINNLSNLAGKQNLQFSLKLTNTLESKNHKEIFDSSQDMMYMSGRALHPVSVNLARKLQNDFSGTLDISFSGGADAFNIVDLVCCGLSPVTVCTDLLKPGGYGRLNQYIQNLSQASIEQTHPLKYLNDYADKVLEVKDYRRTYLKNPDIKTNQPLSFFDCIHAPCETTCPTHQGIPDYLYYTAKGNLDKAAKVVTQTNPFPITTGMVCDHLCQTKCTRINYDSSVLIREVKRVIAENAPEDALKSPEFVRSKNPLKAAVIGAGPSGLSCAYFLTKAGFDVEIFETKKKPGGMVSGAIPSFRLPGEAFELDVKRITDLGINIHYESEINKVVFDKLRLENDFVYIAAGAQKSKPFLVKNGMAKGVLDPLEFLFDVKSGKKTAAGHNILIIGGGNTAMDAARTAWRVAGKQGKVTIAYRRTIKEMPADLGEIKAVIEEGVEIIELVAPVSVNTKDGLVKSMTFRRMKQGAKDESGRARPIEIPGSDFEISADTIIPAIGQNLAFDFLDKSQLVAKNGSYETGIPGVFIGGDAKRGASTAINAIGDGRKAAQEIIDKAGLNFKTKTKTERPEKSFRQHIIDKSKRIKPAIVKEKPVSDRMNFDLVQSPLTLKQGIEESKRCLQCDELCSICTTVCPNNALMTYEIIPSKIKNQKLIVKDGKVQIMDDGFFEVKQKYQILHIADWCNKCGNCNTFCPTEGAPYLNKPHLFLNKEYFESEKTGFFWDGKILHAKDEGDTFSFMKSDHGFYFNTEKIELEINKDFSIEKYKLLTDVPFEMDLSFTAQMMIILESVITLTGLPPEAA